MEKFLQQQGYDRCGDFSYLVHYGFLEKLIGNREDGSKKNGYYKITGRGIMFCEGKTTAKSKFLMFNGKLNGFEGEDITIEKALGKKFNYNELMGKHETAS